MNDYQYEAFVQYIETALWSESCRGQVDHADCRGEDCDKGLDQLHYTLTDFSPLARMHAENDVRDFTELLDQEGVDYSGIDAGQLGHDFWLTRNRHGGGFWDRGLGELGDVLTKWAHSFGEASLSVNGDMIDYER